MRYILATLLLCLPLKAATIICDDASFAEVDAAITSASPGDTVIVPPDATPRDWSPGISFSGITLQGPGRNAASGVTITDGTVTITKHATEYTRLIGFKFTKSSGAAGSLLNAIGGPALKAYICESNHFNASYSHALKLKNGGVFAECSFAAATPFMGTGITVEADNQTTSWSDFPTIGALDPTGESNVYFEDCYYTNILQSISDTDEGGRSVIRHSIIQDSSIIAHGGGSADGGNDTSLTGNKHTEIYKNTFVRQLASANLNEWVQIRGGGCVIISNVIPSNTSGDFPNKLELELSVGCDEGAYPRPYQVGQTTYPPTDATPDFPVLIFGNTGDGTDDPNFLVISENPNNSCADPDAFITLDRDYFLSNQWSWVPYTYPHPLRGESPEAPEIVRIQKVRALRLQSIR
jgi:hypothetical protein